MCVIFACAQPRATRFFAFGLAFAAVREQGIASYTQEFAQRVAELGSAELTSVPNICLYGLICTSGSVLRRPLLFCAPQFNWLDTIQSHAYDGFVAVEVRALLAEGNKLRVEQVCKAGCHAVPLSIDHIDAHCYGLHVRERVLLVDAVVNVQGGPSGWYSLEASPGLLRLEIVLHFCSGVAPLLLGKTNSELYILAPSFANVMALPKVNTSKKLM